jgi:hypothetical protein
MPRRLRGRIGGAGGAALAVALSLALATDAVALTWRTAYALTGPGTGWAVPGSLAVTSVSPGCEDMARVVLSRTGLAGTSEVLYRQTDCAGAAWGPSVRLSRPEAGDAGRAVIDAWGYAYSAAWLESDRLGTGSEAVVVARSTVGSTVRPPVQLSPANEVAGPPRIARYGNRVAIVWTNELDGRIYLRRSTDGGATWLPRQLLATTTSRPYRDVTINTLLDGFPVVAMSAGMVYVAYMSAAHTLRLRVSRDTGASFGSALTLATNAAFKSALGLAASGSTVMVGYAAYRYTDTWPIVRRSTDRGAHWASPVALSPASSYQGFAPLVAVRGSRWMAAFERCDNTACSISHVRYRASTNGGLTWSAAVVASSRHNQVGMAADVDAGSTRTFVLYDDNPSTYPTIREWWRQIGQPSDVYVRAGW